nr:hypothetical protein GCM10025699_70440 [Microbacterium flavescens]
MVVKAVIDSAAAAADPPRVIGPMPVAETTHDAGSARSIVGVGVPVSGVAEGAGEVLGDAATELVVGEGADASVSDELVQPVSARLPTARAVRATMSRDVFM